MSGLNTILPLRFREEKLGSGALILKNKIKKNLHFIAHYCICVTHTHCEIVYRLSSPSSSFL